MTSSSEQRDARLAEALERLLAEAKQGNAAWEEIIAEHPELADELRELWGTIQIASAVAHQSTRDFERDGSNIEEISTDNLPNSLGDYELREEIGRGGMGIVYRARQISLDRDVALKLILRGNLATAQDQARFQAEAQAAAQLDHPHIVPIYEVDSHDGLGYFTMPLVEGVTLSSRMADGLLPNREAAGLVMKIARAIHYAHGRGVVHRDLKPANILLDRQGEPHVTDFGLAKRLHADESLTRTGSIMGTPLYMAPEQAGGNRGAIGPACDIYSLGAILYALVTGRPPIQGPSPVDTLLMVLEQDPLPPRLLNRQLDRDLEMIILRCLQKPPELRYATADELANDLQSYLNNEPVAARSGHFSQVFVRLFRETHHATVLENWGLLWMWHALVLLVLCVVTNWFHVQRFDWPFMNTPLPYLLLWGGGLAVWAPIFWKLRHRAGPVTAVERQIAHVWGSSVAAVILLFVIEALLRLPVLTLSPVLGLIGAMVFAVKAGILAGSFYIQSVALFLTAILMAILQANGYDYGITIYGIVAAASFFIPGLKYYRQSRQQKIS
jgi:serine/threonine-protein kinase